jgi:predicted DNA-binding protein
MADKFQGPDACLREKDRSGRLELQEGAAMELTQTNKSTRMNSKRYRRNSFMPKTITLRLSDEDYQRLLSFARADNRPIANAIETLALRQLDEVLFVDSYEMDEIMSDKDLLKRMKRGHDQALKMKGRFVE